MKRIICFILLVCNLVFFTSCASSCSLFHAYDIPEQVKSLYAEAEIDVAVVDYDRLSLNYDNIVFFNFDEVAERYKGIGVFLEYLAIYKGRVFFISAKKGNDEATLCIGSVKMDGSDLRIKEVGKFGLENPNILLSPNPYNSNHYIFKVYRNLGNSGREQIDNRPLAQFINGYIYVLGNGRMIKFDPNSYEYTECEEWDTSIFDGPYKIEYVYPDSNFTVIDTSTGISKSFDLMKAIEKTCDGKLVSLMNDKRSNGSSFFKVFTSSYISYMEGNLYFTFELLNDYGNEIPMTFKYDFESNELYFLFAGPATYSFSTVYTIPLIN